MHVLPLKTLIFTDFKHKQVIFIMLVDNKVKWEDVSVHLFNSKNRHIPNRLKAPLKLSNQTHIYVLNKWSVQTTSYNLSVSAVWPGADQTGHSHHRRVDVESGGLVLIEHVDRGIGVATLLFAILNTFRHFIGFHSGVLDYGAVH